MRGALAGKAEAFDGVVKPGRTHLQDATPIRVGQVFSGYAAQVGEGMERVERALEVLRELPLGGTAVGTGLNAPPDFAPRAIAHLNRALSTDFVEAENHVAANAARDEVVEVSGLLKTIAVSLTKVADDIRWLASGPRAGLGELCLPAVQPGSSIMPGKVNPVMAEALVMAAAQVVGYDAAIALGGLGGRFELNTMLPLMAHDLLSGVELLANAVRAFTQRALVGLEVNGERCLRMAEGSLALATALAPVTGYDAAAEIAQEAHRTGRTVLETALEMTDLPREELEVLLDPRRLTGE
jgi:fumarate hydratase class II